MNLLKTTNLHSADGRRHLNVWKCKSTVKFIRITLLAFNINNIVGKKSTKFLLPARKFYCWTLLHYYYYYYS